MSSRREARERALSLCYELDLSGRSAVDVLGELPVPPDELTEALVRGVDEHQGELDGLIDGAAEHWSVERMAVVDRCLLRIGCYELGYEPDVPTPVVINEAVELAKRYSTEDSGRFVNGILNAVARKVRPDADDADSPDDSAT